MNVATDAGNNNLGKTITSTTFRRCYHENLFCKSFTVEPFSIKIKDSRSKAYESGYLQGINTESSCILLKVTF